MDEKNKKTPLVVLLAAVIGSVVGSIAVKEVFNRPPSTESLLVQTSNEMNKNLPMMVDQFTRLDATFPGPGKIFNYRYTLVGMARSDLDVEAAKKQITPTVTQNYKTNPAMDGLRKLSTILKYHYHDDTGAFAFVIEVDPAQF